MEKQQELFKGEAIEEHLRNYFNSIGYFVVRGVKYKYENNDITDIDLYLYRRTSSLTRERINVDIKCKKTPQAFERILWTNGLLKLLNFDSCIVATTDKRPVVHAFGQIHNTIILDGLFLSKLSANKLPENRLTDEELRAQLSLHKSYKNFESKDWNVIYEISKSRLLSEQDYSGFNSSINTLEYFIQKALSDVQKREVATRMIYLLFSHLLIIADFIIKDIAFLEQSDKEKKLSDGFKFGNLGKEGVEKIIKMAVKLAGNTSSHSVLKTLDSIPIDILKDFFGKNENNKNLFLWAREFEQLGYNRNFVDPNNIDSSLRSVISIFLDYYNIERRKFYELYNTKKEILALKNILESLSNHAGVMKLINGQEVNYGSIRIIGEDFMYYTSLGLREMWAESSKNSDKAKELQKMSEKKLIVSGHIAVTPLSEIEKIIS